MTLGGKVYVGTRGEVSALGTPGSVMYYATDGTTPTLHSSRYVGPLLLASAMGTRRKAMRVSRLGGAAVTRLVRTGAARFVRRTRNPAEVRMLFGRGAMDL